MKIYGKFNFHLKREGLRSGLSVIKVVSTRYSYFY